MTTDDTYGTGRQPAGELLPGQSPSPYPPTGFAQHAPGYPPPPPPGYGHPGFQPGSPPQAAYARWGRRVGAALIDALIVLPTYIFDITGAAIGGGSGDLITFLGSALALTIMIWNQGVRQGRTGQSIGKSVLGITLLKIDTGRPVGTGLSLGRQIAHIIDCIPFFLGLLWPLWDRKRQTFADKLTSTVVVRVS